MSWAIYAVRGPGGVRRLDDLPDDYAPPSIGTAAEVVERVREVAPQVDAARRSWLVLTGPDHDVEVSIGKDVQVRDVTFYINGGTDSVRLVMDISSRLGLTPYDTESGDFLTEESAPPVPPPLDEDELKDGRSWWQRLTRRND